MDWLLRFLIATTRSTSARATAFGPLLRQKLTSGLALGNIEPFVAVLIELLYKFCLLLYGPRRRTATPETRWSLKTRRRFVRWLCMPDGSCKEPDDSKYAEFVIHKMRAAPNRLLAMTGCDVSRLLIARTVSLNS